MKPSREPRDEVLDLKASVARLAALDGAVVRFVEGVHLVEVKGLARPPRRAHGRSSKDEPLDVRPLVEETQRLGAPTLERFRAIFTSARPPSAVDAHLLSTLRRDLRRVSSESAQEVIARERRIFRKFPPVDARFLEDRAKKLERLSSAGERDRSGVLALVASIRGEEAALRAAAAIESVTSVARSGHPVAIARLAAIRSLPADDPLADELRRVARLPGRARARRIAKILALAVSRPVPTVPADRPFGAQVEIAVDALIASFASALPPDFDARVERCVGGFALVVAGSSRMPCTISPSDFLDAEQRLGLLAEELDGRALDASEAIVLAGRAIQPRQTAKLVAWVEGGLTIAEVRAVVAADALDSLLQVEGDARLASTWAAWVSQLVPHFRSLGLAVNLDPSVLAGVRASQEELAVLAQCLIEQDQSADPRTERSVEAQLAALDATLALFARAPARIREAIAAMRETSSGEGRARFPVFSAFVGDDARIDRYLHLARLAGEPAAPSQALLEDCELLTELAGQLAHLEAMDPDALQAVHRGRIETLRASIGAGPPSPERTKRRLDARIAALLPRAYRQVLDRILGEVLREAWGISARKKSEAWRDAIRFFLTIDDNRAHLRTLLRHASIAPGAPIERTLPLNRAFIAALKGKVDIDAFLAPRRSALTLDGVTYSIELEEDPIEVLRMGIPFDTCLSLTDGCNAASTVLNAIEANKRVIYVRDAARAIVGRKLVAISEEGRLLGYRLYCSVAEIQSALEIAVDSFARALASACRIDLADSGEPRTLHSGFWYDDGAVAWPSLSPDDAVARYCAHLGRPVPKLAPKRLCDEARRFVARESGDVEAMIAALPRWIEGPGDALLGDRAVASLGLEASVARAASVVELCAPIARSLSRGTLGAMASEARRVDAHALDELNESIAEHHSRHADSPDAIVPLLSLAKAAIRAGHVQGLAHTSFDLARHFAAAPVRVFFAQATRLERLHSHIVSRSARCAGCRENAVEQLKRAIETAYARAPDPDAVIAALRSARSSDLARTLAIRIAARFPLDRAHFGRFDGLSRGTAAKAPTGLVAALMAIARAERAVDPEVVAAIIRQGGPRGRAKLPLPSAPPFAAFRDLLFDPTVDGVLEPFLVPRTLPSDPFELHVHRRIEGEFRQSLRRRAIEGDGAAASCLALLGDVAAVERAKEAGVGPIAQRLRGPIAHAIARGDGISLPEQVLRGKWPMTVIDPTLVMRALGCVEAAGEGLDGAISTLRATKDPAWFDAVLSIAEREEPWVRDQVLAYADSISAGHHGLERIGFREAFLLAKKGWSDPVAAVLGRGHATPFDVAADRALRTWTALGTRGEAEALFRRVLAVLADTPAQAFSVEDPDRRDLLLDVLTERSSTQTRAAFLAIEDYESLSRLLDRVGPAVAPALEISGIGAVLRSWLDAAPPLAQEGS